MVLEHVAGRSEGKTAALASVVPPVVPLIQQALEHLGFGNVLVVRSGLKTGIAIITTIRTKWDWTGW
jgi:hypothetical protein